MPKSFITHEFFDEGVHIKLWSEITDEGKVLNEHGAFTIKHSDNGHIMPCDAFGRVPGQTKKVTDFLLAERLSREEKIRERKKEHLRKLSQGTM